ncbi:MAG: bifunctional (p)ppGpp synthetase/guanosine-3',5'-bis(diphosphate) 3'-pyrophosphohydrolase [Pseudomonadota bacterium]
MPVSPAPVAPMRISDLCEAMEVYLNPAQIREVYRSYLFAAEAHEGQTRLSGEAYIYHPVAVAAILVQMRMDHHCVMAAILHDVIEDTSITKPKLKQAFTDEVVEMVDGVSKLTYLKFRSRAEAQAENFRKMMLAMTQDVRIILIKLADRLHNMRTLEVMPPVKARRIARETLDIYIPIANRLGINNIRHELEELAMAAHWPRRYQVMRETLQQRRGNRREWIDDITRILSERLVKDGLSAEVRGREKRAYSTYKKMQAKQCRFSDLADVYAFRVIVDQVDTCYRVLGAVHNLYRPMPGKFKDYIAIPKANGYQSLHTVLMGPQGLPIEIQIRTQAMHVLAEQGIAAHWQYKGERQGSATADAAAKWLRSLLEVQQNTGDSMEFLEHVKVDLYPDEVYVFTPRGQIVELPRGATVIDFAYAIHSNIGNHCVAARIDQQLAPLRSQLRNGQTVEIITKQTATPKPGWLNFAMTGKARTGIRAYLKQLETTEAAALGQRLLEHELGCLGTQPEQIEPGRQAAMLHELGYTDLSELQQHIGLGNRSAALAARLLAFPKDQTQVPVSAPLSIQGGEGMLIHFARCCGPVPGDPIIAIFSRGRGMLVHHQHCPNSGDFRRRGKDWLEVQWDDQVSGEFHTTLRVDAGNQRGMLATVAAVIADSGSNIEDVRSEERDGLSSRLRFTLLVKDRKHLADVLRRIRALPQVLKVGRVIG